MSTPRPARTYNQDHMPRKYTPGKRRMSIYWTWSYPWESQRDPAEMDNRYSTMTEVRKVLWPNYETPEWSAAQFLQGIAGTLELFHRSTLSFQQTAGARTVRSNLKFLSVRSEHSEFWPDCCSLHLGSGLVGCLADLTLTLSASWLLAPASAISPLHLWSQAKVLTIQKWSLW